MTSIEVTDVSGIDPYDELEDQTPRVSLRITDVSGVLPEDETERQARAEVEEKSLHPTVPGGGGQVSGVAPGAGLLVGYLSYSQIETYLNCPLAYWKRYGEKKRPKQHPAARLGTLVHRVLETCYEWILENKYRGKFPLDRAMKCLTEAWSDPKEGLAGEAFGWWHDATSMLRTYAQSTPTVDYISIVGVEIGREDDDPETGERVKPKPTITLGGFPFVALIDKVEIVGDGHIKVSDYKSDRQIRYREDVDRDLQLSIYEIAARRRWPRVERVTLELNMLRHGIVQQSRTRTPEDLEDAELFVGETGRTIVRDTEWKPKLNRYCHTCAFKGECPAYAESMHGVDEDSMLNRDLVQIGNSFEGLGNLRDELEHRGRLLDKRRNEIDSALKGHLELVPGGDIKTSSKEYYVGMVTRREFPRLETVETIARSLKVPSGVVDAAVCGDAEKGKIDGIVNALKKGQTLGEAFGFSWEGSDQAVAGPFLSMLQIELESIARSSSFTRIMSRNRKTPEVSAKDRKKQKESAASTATLPAGSVEAAAEASRDLFSVRGIAQVKQLDLVALPAPKPAEPEIDLETAEQVVQAWRWGAVGEVEPIEPRFSAEPVEWMDPALALTLWRHIGETTPKGAARVPGVLGRRTDFAAPVVAAAAVQGADAPAPKRQRKAKSPISEESRVKMAEAARMRWQKRKLGIEQP